MANKVLLLQLANNDFWEQWITDSAGVWYVDFRGAYTGIDPVLGAEPETANVTNVNSVVCNGLSLTHVTSYTDTIDGRATALATTPSFIFDTSGKILYIRLSEYDPPFVCDVVVGITLSISNQAYDDTTNGIQYRPDLINIPDIPEEKDPLFYQRIAFSEYSQRINNAGRNYDYLINNEIFGQSASYYWGDPTQLFSTFTKVKEGKVKTYQYDDDQLVLRIIDSRAILSRPVPTNKLDQTTYTDLQDKYIGAAKPLVYGFVKDMKCLPLDDDTTQTNYTFLIADTEFHDIRSTNYTITMDDEDKTAQVINFSASNGTFQLPAAHYTKDKDVLFSGWGYVDGGGDVIDNALDVILDILDNYIEIGYSATTFNTTEWDAETLTAPNIGIAIQEVQPAVEVLETISTGTGGGFLVERDGRYTWRSYDATADPILTVRQEQWKYTPVVVGKSEEVLTSAAALYDRSIERDLWSRVEDDSKETEIFSKYQLYQSKEFETVLYQASDALSFAQDIMSRSDEIGLTISGVLDDKYIDLSIVTIGKLAQIQVNRQTSKTGDYDEWLGIMRCEILGVYPNLDDREVEIEFRRIETLDDFIKSEYRITEADEYRITEADEFRITEFS